MILLFAANCAATCDSSAVALPWLSARLRNLSSCSRMRSIIWRQGRSWNQHAAWPLASFAIRQAIRAQWLVFVLIEGRPCKLAQATLVPTTKLDAIRAVCGDAFAMAIAWCMALRLPLVHEIGKAFALTILLSQLEPKWLQNQI